ncbi:transmembrane protein 134 isoform X1 [Balaenoptera acutorostrata]|uniref:Transmembrane protein 134 isoform X1 n=1 Tax=Balaenoptera acutorostrata TaxID=9767 RepID=A0ABM3U4V2_BALAC|nr:transmembrane protein 134 isoform X1 [Balaenoptera acutorostrata]
MSAARPQFSIDDAFELSLEDAGPGPESSGVARFGPLHFERRARFEVADEDKQSRLRYQNLENDEDGAQASPEPDGGASTRDSGRTSIRSSQWSFSNISTSTQRSYNACCSWTQHPLIQKNHRVVLASFLLLLLGLACLIHQGRVTATIYSLSTSSQVQGRLIFLPYRGHTASERPKPCWGLRAEVPTLPPAPAPAPALTLVAPPVCSADPDRRGTGGGPLARCLHRHLLRARLPVAGPGSLPRDLHLLRGQGPPGLPVLLPALLREVSRRRRTAGSIVGAERPSAASSRP